MVIDIESRIRQYGALYGLNYRDSLFLVKFYLELGSIVGSRGGLVSVMVNGGGGFNVGTSFSEFYMRYKSGYYRGIRRLLLLFDFGLLHYIYTSKLISFFLGDCNYISWVRYIKGSNATEFYSNYNVYYLLKIYIRRRYSGDG